MNIKEAIQWLRCGDDKANAAADAVERELKRLGDKARRNVGVAA